MELGWLHKLLQKRKTGVRVVSVCFDESRETAEKTLMTIAGAEPMVRALKDLGVKLDEQPPETAVLRRLSELGVKTDSAAAREAVLATLRHLGVDFDRLAKRNGDPIRAAYGERFTLHVVPEDQQNLYFQATGRKSFPQTFLIDQQGTLRYDGYPHEDVLEEWVTRLLKGQPAQEETERGASP